MATITTRSGKGSALTHQEVDANFTGLNTELGQKELASNKGVANGYASLDAAGKVPSAQLPSYVDDVVEAANLASLPGTGETGKIYVTLDTNKTYRWSGSAYVEISPSPGSTDSLAEGSTNLYFTQARARASVSASGSLSYNSSTGVFSFSDAVTSVAGRTGAVTLTSSDVGLGNVENKSSATIRGELTSGNVTSALGFTPYNATNPSGYTNNTGTVTSVSGTGTVSGLTLTGTVTGSGSLTLGGTLSLTSGQVTTALGYTPYNSSNPSAYITSSSNITGNAATATTASQLNGYFSSSYSGPTSVVKQFFWDNLSSNGGQARTFEIARLGIDYNDWNTGIGPFEVELYEAYYSRGLKKKYVIYWGYSNVYGMQLVEYSGNGDNNFQVRIGTPVQVSGDNYYLPVFVDVRYYSYIDVRVTTNRDITASNPPGIGSAYINAAPSATNISDFTADSTVNFASTTAVQINGNQLLHAGNYSSYALPLSGGTLTGAIYVGTTGSGSATRALRVGPSGGNPASFGSYTGSWRSTIEIWDNAATRMLHLTPPDGENYNWSSIKSVGAGLRIDVGGSGGTNAIDIGTNGVANFPQGLQQGGNQVLHAGNYNSYAFRAVTVEGGIVTPTGGLNGAIQGWAAYDGYGGPVPNYGGADWWVGAFTGGNSTRGFQIAGGYSDSEMYFRKGNGGWSAWRRTLTDANYGSYALPITGGSLTGNLTFDGASDKIITIRTASNWYYYLKGEGDNFRIYDAEGLNFLRAVYNGGGAGKCLQILGSTLQVNNNNTVTSSGALTVSGTIAGGGRVLAYSTTISMSGLDSNTYYPVTIPLPSHRTTRLRIQNALNSNVPSWSTHPGGFSCYIEWITNGLGWGTIPAHRRVNDWRESFTNVTIVGGLTQLGNSSQEVIWLRGGGNYFFSADCDVVPTIRTSYYEIYGQSVNTSGSVVNTPWDQVGGRMSYGTFHATSSMLVGSNTVLHAGNYGGYALPIGGGTMTGTIYSNASSIIIGQQGGSTRGYLYNDSAGFGFLTSGGSWAAYVPLGTNNWQVNGSITASGNVTAYSDERLKKDWSLIESGFVNRLAVLRCGTYTRIDSGQRQAGVSAQNMREILPEVVSEDNDGTLALAYGNAAMVSAVELAKELVALKHKVAALEARVH